MESGNTMKKFLYTIVILALLSGCNKNIEQITETNTAETALSTTKVTEETIAETSLETSAETEAESTESSTAETEYKGFDYEEYFNGMEYFFSYDLNGDGLEEDLFISTYYENDEICAAVYSNDKSKIADSVRIERMDSYDIYRSYNYYYDGREVRFLMYTSNDPSWNIYNGFIGMDNGAFWQIGGYTMTFYDWCSWHWYNVLTSREEFEETLADKKKFLKYVDCKDPELYDTINIKEKLAEKFDYSENFIGRIEEVGLDVFELENDPFGKKYKFKSGELCCYTLGGENIKIYSRPREIWVGFNMDGHNEENGETEYLVSVSSGDGENGTMEFIYTGTESENYAAVYDRCVYASDGSLDRFRPDEEKYKQAANNTDKFLAEKRWILVGEAKINAA